MNTPIARRRTSASGYSGFGGSRDRPSYDEKNEIKPWVQPIWCIPPEQDGAFVAAMERVLAVYHRPYDACFPVVNMDEQPVQLLSESRRPLPMRPGRTKPIFMDLDRPRCQVSGLFHVKRNSYQDSLFHVKRRLGATGPSCHGARILQNQQKPPNAVSRETAKKRKSVQPTATHKRRNCSSMFRPTSDEAAEKVAESRSRLPSGTSESACFPLAEVPSGRRDPLFQQSPDGCGNALCKMHGSPTRKRGTLSK